MPAIEFEIPQTPEHPLVVAWRGLYQDIKVLHGGALVGQVYAVEELLKGAEFTLPDGQRLTLKFAASADGIGLRAWRAAEPLARTRAALRRAVRPAALALGLVALQSLFIGLIGLVVAAYPRLSFGLVGGGLLPFVIGLLYAGLAYGVGRAWLPALVAALSLYLLEAVVSIGLGIVNGTPPTLVALFIRLLVLGLLFTAYEPIASLNTASETPPKA